MIKSPSTPFARSFQYNNLGYELAGHIIDKTSGTTWAEMLKRSIFRPLRMDRTFLHDPTEASYALGWGRIQLPGTMDDIGINPPLMPDGMPVVGKGSSRLVIFHQAVCPVLWQLSTYYLSRTAR